MSLNPIFYGYNTENVRPEDVPADDDATLYVFGGIVRQYGWGYMDQYMKQQPKFVQGHLDVARSLGSGESLVKVGRVLVRWIALPPEKQSPPQ